MADKLSEELKKALKDIVTECEKEDAEARDNLIKIWKKHEAFWAGFQYLFWNAKETRWMNIDELDDDSEELAEELGSFYDYVVDIFKAHGESIIAALSAQIPGLRHIPDDADSQEDIDTARTYDRIGDLIQRHNKAKLIFLQALFYLYINGIVFSYRYKDADPKYGVYKVPSYETQKVNQTTCVDCGYTASDTLASCPECGSTDTITEESEQPIQTGYTEQPKTRVKIEVYGGLFVKIPIYAQNQDQCSYLGHYIDLPIDTVQYAHQDDAEVVKQLEGERLSNKDRFSVNEYNADVEIGARNLVTVKKYWLRPSRFFLEKDEDNRRKLLKKYPTGVRVELAGKSDIFLSASEESLDDRWEIGKCGLSTFIHAAPKGNSVISLQELKNQMTNLAVETVEHGIPTEYADPEVVNFREYGKYEAIPGAVYKAKPKTPLAPLAQSFYTSPRATLSKELPLINKQIEQDAQFALGSFPSIFGGPGQGNSRTYSEYAASRQMALQRLSIDWEFVKDWWTRTVHGAVKMYAETVQEDDRFVQIDRENYINVWIRKARLSGKIGGVEPEASESFPISLAQKKDLIVKLLELQNPVILNALFTPDNATILQNVLALNEFKIPGEAQRVKQIKEINEMIRPNPETGEIPEPVPQTDPQTGKPSGQYQSTVAVDIDVDDHQIHIQTIREFAVSELGIDLKETNPQAYVNIISHMKQHQQVMLMQTIGQGPQGEPPGQQPASVSAGVQE